MENSDQSFRDSLIQKIKRVWEEVKTDKKTFIKATAVVLVGPLLASAKVTSTGTRLLDSKVAALFLLIILFSGIVKVARLHPKGWLWLASFCYISAYAHPGVIMAWVYLILSILSFWVYRNWKSHAMGK